MIYVAPSKNCVEVSVRASRGQPFDEQDWEQLVQGVAGTKNNNWTDSFCAGNVKRSNW